ncbi:hypothetical protein [Streptomyces sp. MST-110588]|uniref:hypothetical protein n=1 Tax=Streptomyces sp. MST-110588 TaxID=2833628 RepID=UPI001F5C6C93|nr:hypothetical protein [Streptomyces sp. MST-110588]UNO39816.1 hypothetical protein KGS77_09715 [Streptomyces sp. MST-110588]
MATNRTALAFLSATTLGALALGAVGPAAAADRAQLARAQLTRAQLTRAQTVAVNDIGALSLAADRLLTAAGDRAAPAAQADTVRARLAAVLRSTTAADAALRAAGGRTAAKSGDPMSKAQDTVRRQVAQALAAARHDRQQTGRDVPPAGTIASTLTGGLGQLLLGLGIDKLIAEEAARQHAKEDAAQAQQTKPADATSVAQPLTQSEGRPAGAALGAEKSGSAQTPPDEQPAGSGGAAADPAPSTTPTDTTTPASTTNTTDAATPTSPATAQTGLNPAALIQAILGLPAKLLSILG